MSGPVLTYISLLIIPCMIVYVTNNKEPWTLIYSIQSALKCARHEFKLYIFTEVYDVTLVRAWRRCAAQIHEWMFRNKVNFSGFPCSESREQWTLCREHVNRNTVHAWSALLTSWLSESGVLTKRDMQNMQSEDWNWEPLRRSKAYSVEFIICTFIRHSASVILQGYLHHANISDDFYPFQICIEKTCLSFQWNELISKNGLNLMWFNVNMHGEICTVTWI